MRRSRTSLLSALVCVLVTAVPGTSLLAQPTAGEGFVRPASTGDGLWWGIAVEAAGTRLTCDFCDRSRDLGVGLEASAGAHASPAVRVGVEAGGWTHREGDVREDVYTAGITAQVHPRAGSGLHLLGGVGWAGFRAGDFELDMARIRVGLGWDLPVLPGWVVGNRVVLDAGSFANLSNGDAAVAESVGLSVVRFALYVRHR